ncbi:hypothetical protein SAMN03080615_03575 [Amphritea atlantica]|uniref:Tetratricopeptide repeat-containing protein n=1 Tax=Amphritea atlantica TaxID=355243 RepID=A0A1H9KP27_9GAMM|nr:hypothetical protein [Amphritea atlantica]SER00904.1 hypothetical protein SAMN03080615_03575 [Amphritea atlantica]
MDLHSFEEADLYFEAPLAPEVMALLNQAADAYSRGQAEPYLIKARFMAPQNLMVLVALYRFYYYQHRYTEALEVAGTALEVSGKMFGFDLGWRRMTLEHLSYGMVESFGMVRFYLLALKGSGYLCLRLGELEEGIERLEKVVALDSPDRLGARSLLEVAYNQKGIYSLDQRMSA